MAVALLFLSVLLAFCDSKVRARGTCLVEGSLKLSPLIQSLSLVPRPHGEASGLGTLPFQICSAVNEIHSFLRT